MDSLKNTSFTEGAQTQAEQPTAPPWAYYVPGVGADNGSDNFIFEGTGSTAVER